MASRIPVLAVFALLIISLGAMALGGPDAPGAPATAVHEATDLDPAGLRAAAASGALHLTLGNAPRTLLLEPNEHLVAPDAWVRADGVDVERPDIDLYTGSLEGFPASHARLAITDTFARGYVFDGLTSWTLGGDADGLQAFTDRPPAHFTVFEDETLGITAADVHGATRGTAEEQGVTGCLGATPEVHVPPQELVLGFPDALTYQILVDSDQTFAQEFGSGWAAEQLAHLNLVDGIYSNNFNIRIQVVGQHVDSTGATYTSSDSGTLLNQARSKWSNDPTDRDTVHLLVDRDLDGATVGQAHCIGGAHSPLTHYTVTQTHGLSTFWSSVITAHEFGHMMSAHHHYANCVESMLSPGTIDLCTVMINAVDLVDGSAVFSSLSKSTIRAYGEDVL